MAQEAPFGSPAKIVSADALLSTLVPASTDAPSEPISPASNLFNRPSTQAGQQQSEPRKGTRRRNKPSLSCQACIGKKTKVRKVQWYKIDRVFHPREHCWLNPLQCDRTRPMSECHYSELADLIEYGDIQPFSLHSMN
ncbi:MAG: hypothetical protein Q9211_001198 [Gyalolechia sp. 1 TL-2023]